MICLLPSSVYATDVSAAEEKQDFFSRLTSTISSARSYLLSIKTTMQTVAAAWYTVLYFMQNSLSNFVLSLNGTNAQLVPFQGVSVDNGFNKMA